MSVLDGAAAATVKPKVQVHKPITIDSNKKDAQNYFKSLSSAVKKSKPTIVLDDAPTVEQEIVS